MISRNSNLIPGIAPKPLAAAELVFNQSLPLIPGLELKISPRSPRAGSSGSNSQIHSPKRGNRIAELVRFNSRGFNQGNSVRGKGMIESGIPRASAKFNAVPQLKHSTGRMSHEATRVNCPYWFASNCRVKCSAMRGSNSCPSLNGNKTATSRTTLAIPLFFAVFCSPSSPVVGTTFIPGLNPGFPPQKPLFVGFSARSALALTSTPFGHLLPLFRAAKGSNHQARMKITKTKNHGQIRYRVNEPQGPDGKRLRKFFDTREAAEQYAKERTADSKAYGVHFVTIPPAERAALAYQLQRLKFLGCTLVEVHNTPLAPQADFEGPEGVASFTAHGGTNAYTIRRYTF